jgi:toxin ParE1/3/4
VRLRFTPRARRHLDAISEYMTKGNQDAARRVGARIRETIDLLSAFPDMGHEGALSATREMIVPGLPYIVVHRIKSGDEETLVILGIYHGVQLRRDRSGYRPTPRWLRETLIERGAPSDGLRAMLDDYQQGPLPCRCTECARCSPSP